MNLESGIVVRRGVEEALKGRAAHRWGAHVGVRGRRRTSQRRLLRSCLARDGVGVGVAAGGHDGDWAGRSRSDLGWKGIWELGFGEGEGRRLRRFRQRWYLGLFCGLG